jgi:hypothetical protein
MAALAMPVWWGKKPSILTVSPEFEKGVTELASKFPWKISSLSVEELLNFNEAYNAFYNALDEKEQDIILRMSIHIDEVDRTDNQGLYYVPDEIREHSDAYNHFRIIHYLAHEFKAQRFKSAQGFMKVTRPTDEGLETRDAALPAGVPAKITSYLTGQPGTMTQQRAALKANSVNPFAEERRAIVAYQAARAAEEAEGRGFLDGDDGWGAMDTRIRQSRGVAEPPLSVNDVARAILEYAQELGANPRHFATLEGGLRVLSGRFPQFAALPSDQQQQLYIHALQDLSSQQTAYTGGPGRGGLQNFLQIALDAAMRGVSVLRNPSNILNVASETLLPALMGERGGGRDLAYVIREKRRQNILKGNA